MKPLHNKLILHFVIIVFLICYVSVGIKANPVKFIPPKIAQEDTTGDYATFWIVIADTGKNYKTLDSKMYALQGSMHIKVDTMDRYYNRKKDEIVVSQKDEDEMYRGEYYPRRYPSVSLSLEYFSMYNDRSDKKNIALVTGIYKNSKAANSALKMLRKYSPHSFIQKANVFIGCMH